jgi:hypothetical protein
METNIETGRIETSTPRSFARCFYVGDWEQNGYHDSYFSVVWWDDAAGREESAEYGATAYAGGWNWRADLARDWPADVVARWRAWRLAGYRNSIGARETARCCVPEPAEMPFGTRVRMLRASKSRACRTPWAAGEVGEVSGHYWHGTFFANGYKRKERANGRLGIRMADGRTVFAAMSAVRLDCEPDAAAIEAEARRIAGGPPLCPGAWWSAFNPLLG